MHNYAEQKEFLFETGVSFQILMGGLFILCFIFFLIFPDKMRKSKFGKNIRVFGWYGLFLSAIATFFVAMDIMTKEFTWHDYITTVKKFIQFLV